MCNLKWGCLGISRQPNPKRHRGLRKRTIQSELPQLCQMPRRLSIACSKRKLPGIIAEHNYCKTIAVFYCPNIRIWFGSLLRPNKCELSNNCEHRFWVECGMETNGGVTLFCWLTTAGRSIRCSWSTVQALGALPPRRAPILRWTYRRKQQPSYSWVKQRKGWTNTG